MNTSTSIAPHGHDARLATQLEEHLAAHLPGLSDSDLVDLTNKVTAELEERVGKDLSAGLTDAQLSEFEELLDGDDGAACTDWLAAARPNYRATVATQCARLIAEVVEKISAADPGTTKGVRRFGQIFERSLDLVEQHLTSREVKYLRQPDEVLSVAFAAGEADEMTVIRVNLAGPGGDLFAFTGSRPEQTHPAGSAPALHAFVADWNAKTWMPKAVVSTDEGSGACQIVAEVAIPAGGTMTREYVDGMVTRCFSSILGLFAAVRRELGGQARPAAVEDSVDRVTADVGDGRDNGVVNPRNIAENEV